MSYTAVIIDDEPWSLLDMQKSFPFEEFGFELVGSFQNSRAAYESIVENQPDLVVTDIRMPNMDGLEMIKLLREQDVTSEIVIISGFSDFEYAKKALQHGVSDYCLKPTDRVEVRKALAKVKQKLDDKSEQEASDRSAEITGFTGMINYIDSHYHQKLTLGELAERFSLNPNYCCALFSKNKGTTFSHYLMGLRIEKAKELIESGSSKLEEISLTVGFTDYFYFSKAFKKICGLSPREYKKGKEIQV